MKLSIPNRPPMTVKSHAFIPFPIADYTDQDYQRLHTDTPITTICMECGQCKHYRLHLEFQK